MFNKSIMTLFFLPVSFFLFHLSFSVSAREEYVATFKGSEYFCYDLSPNPIQSSSDEITLSFKTLQRNGLMLHTGKSADYVNLALKNGAVSLVINLGSGAFEALVEPVNGKFNDNAWHDVKVTRNLRQVTKQQEMEEKALRTGEKKRLGDNKLVTILISPKEERVKGSKTGTKVFESGGLTN